MMPIPSRAELYLCPAGALARVTKVLEVTCSDRFGLRGMEVNPVRDGHVYRGVSNRSALGVGERKNQYMLGGRDLPPLMQRGHEWSVRFTLVVPAETEQDACDLCHLSAYHDLPDACIISECKLPLNASRSPAMIQSGISTFPWIYALWNCMKIGLDCSQVEPVTFRYF